MKIQMIDPRVLIDHPKNAHYYGAPTLPEAFIESVSEHGILQNLTVTLVASGPHKGKYMVVSGHRRRDAAILLGIHAVPCEVREYATPEEMERDLLAMNLQRVKTEHVLTREIEGMMALYAPLAEKRMKAGKEVEPSSQSGTRVRTDDLIAEKLNISRRRVRDLLHVFGSAHIEKCTQTIRDSGLSYEAVIAAWNDIRRQRINDEISLSRAVKLIDDLMFEASRIGRAVPQPKLSRKPVPPLRLAFGVIGDDVTPTVCGSVPVGDALLELGTVGDQPCLKLGDKFAVIDAAYLTQLTQ